MKKNLKIILKDKTLEISDKYLNQSLDESDAYLY